MIKEILFNLIDFILEYIFKLLSFLFKKVTPIKIYPKKINEVNNEEWESIFTLEIKNRLNSDIYDLNIVGMSKDDFNIKIIGDNRPTEKIFTKMRINPEHLVLYVEDGETKNKGWIYRLNQIKPKEKFVLKFKIKNSSAVYFKVLHYSYKEIAIKERSDGALAIPFIARKLPKI